jgi:hypothetical protein
MVNTKVISYVSKNPQKKCNRGFDFRYMYTGYLNLRKEIVHVNIIQERIIYNNSFLNDFF